MPIVGRLQTMVKPMPAVMQPPHRILGGVGQDLVLGHQRAVDVGYHEGDFGHAVFLPAV